jgi:cytochrome c-type biogenesis protein CcmH/NrfG
VLCLDRTNPIALATLARHAMTLAHYGNAATLYERLLAIDPQHRSARAGLERARNRLSHHSAQARV